MEVYGIIVVDIPDNSKNWTVDFVDKVLELALLSEGLYQAVEDVDLWVDNDIVELPDGDRFYRRPLDGALYCIVEGKPTNYLVRVVDDFYYDRHGTYLPLDVVDLTKFEEIDR